MLIVGAKGFAKEVLEVLYQNDQLENLVFYDDVSQDLPELLFDKYKILSNLDEASIFFSTIDNRFTLGLGNPFLRKTLCDKFEMIGGELVSTISPQSTIGHFGNILSNGLNILSSATISNGVKMGKGCIIYFGAIITHDCSLGDFVEISPGSQLLGKCSIGSFSQVGANSTILPKVNIGKNVVIGAGSVVTKDTPDNCLVVGVPAIIKRALSPLVF